MRAATRLAVDGDEAFAHGTVAGKGVGDPGLETALEGFGFESKEQSADAIARGNAVRQGQMLSKPVFAFFCPAMHGRRAIATAQDAADRDDDDIDEEVFAVACVPGIGKRLEVGSNRANIDELGHESYPCHRLGTRQDEPTAARDRPIAVRYKDISRRQRAQASQIAYLCALALFDGQACRWTGGWWQPGGRGEGTSEGFRWRNSKDLAVNYVWVYLY